MTNRVALPPQDFQKMCKQAERDQESRKLLVLMERVKRQIAELEKREQGGDGAKRPATAIREEADWTRFPRRLAPFER